MSDLLRSVLLFLGVTGFGIDVRTNADAAVGFAYALINPRVTTVDASDAGSAASPKPETTPAVPMATQDQFDAIKALAKNTGWTNENYVAYKASMKPPHTHWREFTATEAAALIDKLQTYERELAAWKAKHAAPIPQTCPAGGCRQPTYYRWR